MAKVSLPAVSRIELIPGRAWIDRSQGILYWHGQSADVRGNALRALLLIVSRAAANHGDPTGGTDAVTYEGVVRLFMNPGERLGDPEPRSRASEALSDLRRMLRKIGAGVTKGSDRDGIKILWPAALPDHELPQVMAAPVPAPIPALEFPSTPVSLSPFSASQPTALSIEVIEAAVDEGRICLSAFIAEVPSAPKRAAWIKEMVAVGVAVNKQVTVIDRDGLTVSHLSRAPGTPFRNCRQGVEFVDVFPALLAGNESEIVEVRWTDHLRAMSDENREELPRNQLRLNVGLCAYIRDAEWYVIWELHPQVLVTRDAADYVSTVRWLRRNGWLIGREIDRRTFEAIARAASSLGTNQVPG